MVVGCWQAVVVGCWQAIVGCWVVAKSPYLFAVHVENMLGDVKVVRLIALVEHDEEEVEARHDGRGKVHVGLEALGAIITARLGVGGGEDRRAGIEGGLDAGLGDRDRLLLHRLVDRHLG